MDEENHFEYKIKKRKAVKIEPLPAPKERPIQKRISTHTTFVGNKRKKKKDSRRDCVICGQTAAYLTYFQVDGAKMLEKYCSECLDKWVYLDESDPILGK